MECQIPDWVTQTYRVTPDNYLSCTYQLYTWARFLSPMLKPESLGILHVAPIHLTVFYLHSK